MKAPDFYHIQNDFLKRVIQSIEENMSDEEFGVSELAEAVSMSRSNLLRKIKKLTDLSVSVLIRQVRLHHAKQMLKDESFSVSEISYKVGFGSTSYFIKCFREQYGYPPGEESSKASDEDIAEHKSPRKISASIGVGVSLIILVIAIFYFQGRSRSLPEYPLEKSIAVLPFKNDSDDSTNVYLINGLMEAILNNLQKIEDLRVISRTSVEKYRTQPKSISEIADELDVNYFVEGSGQKVGDQILLTIQLIEAPRDKHLWSERYDREAKNIFQLQMEVAQDIAGQIEAIITPEEQERIEKIPTENLAAYDLYLKGLEFSSTETPEGLDSALVYFQKAIVEDDQFAHPYALTAICYYYKDLFQIEKHFGEEINTYADKALLLDSELPQSLIAKALFYMQDRQYLLAEEYFLKVLEFNPNSGWTNNYLSEIYTSHIPNTRKYLEYALRGARLELGNDSTMMSFTFLHLSNALLQTGFIEKGEEYILKSLDYNENNLFSQYVYAYALMAKDFDMDRTKSMLIEVLEKDTARIDVLQEVGKAFYSTEDYENAILYYEKFVAIEELLGLDVFPAEDLKIGFVLEQLGRKEEAQQFYQQFKEFADNDQSIYKDLSLAGYFAATGDIEKGIEHLKIFSDQENFMYWFTLMKDDPIMKRLGSHPEFIPTMDRIGEKFWAEHEEMKKYLKEEKLL